MADTLTSLGLTKIEVGASDNTWGTKLNTDMDLINILSLGHYTAGGSANARTITTGLSLSSIPTGFQVRFVASATNTTSMTLNVDSVGAVTCKTITGENLPADYIIASGITVARYNGTNWIVERPIENITTGGSGTGTAVRFPDGTQICYLSPSNTDGITTASGSIYISPADYEWTFRAAFSAAPIVSGSLGSVNRMGGVSGWGVVGSATVWTYRLWSATSLAAPTGITARLMAVGTWY